MAFSFQLLKTFWLTFCYFQYYSEKNSYNILRLIRMLQHSLYKHTTWIELPKDISLTTFLLNLLDNYKNIYYELHFNCSRYQLFTSCWVCQILLSWHTHYSKHQNTLWLNIQLLVSYYFGIYMIYMYLYLDMYITNSLSLISKKHPSQMIQDFFSG